MPSQGFLLHTKRVLFIVTSLYCATGYNRNIIKGQGTNESFQPLTSHFGRCKHRCFSLERPPKRFMSLQYTQKPQSSIMQASHVPHCDELAARRRSLRFLEGCGLVPSWTDVAPGFFWALMEAFAAGFVACCFSSDFSTSIAPEAPSSLLLPLDEWSILL